MNKHTLFHAIAATALCGAGHGTLLLDFNSNQAGGGTPITGSPADPTTPVHNETGYQSYHVSHELGEQLNPATPGSYNTNFALTGASVTTVTPAWINTTDNRVRQSIGRSDGQAASWLGNNVNLLRDWIGVDARTGNGGNFDSGPTYMTLTLGGLPAADYTMTTFHHDVENMNAFFSLEVSTDGGSTFGTPLNGRMTNSLAGGTPAENEILPGDGINVAGGDPSELSSTLNLGFTAVGDDVVLRFTPLVTDPGTGVHQAFFGINGFQLSQVPEPSTGLLALVGLGFLARRRR